MPNLVRHWRKRTVSRQKNPFVILTVEYFHGEGIIVVVAMVLVEVVNDGFLSTLDSLQRIHYSCCRSNWHDFFDARAVWHLEKLLLPLHPCCSYFGIFDDDEDLLDSRVRVVNLLDDF